MCTEAHARREAPLRVQGPGYMVHGCRVRAGWVYALLDLHMRPIDDHTLAAAERTAHSRLASLASSGLAVADLVLTNAHPRGRRHRRAPLYPCTMHPGPCTPCGRRHRRAPRRQRRRRQRRRRHLGVLTVGVVR